MGTMEIDLTDALEPSEEAIATRLALLRLEKNDDIWNKHPDEIAKEFIQYQGQFRIALNSKE